MTSTGVAESSASATSAVAAARMADAVKIFGAGPTLVRALDDITVTFAGGQFTAIMGPSGSGKSTMLHCLAGLDRLTSGRAFVGDTDLGRLNDNEMTILRRERIGFVFQAFNLVPTLTPRDNILLPLTLGGRRPDAAWFDALVRTLHIEDRLAHRPSELSGGEQQRVAMGRALITRPALVFADEPTGNLDSKSAGGLLEQMRSAVDGFGQTVVMVTHDARAAGFADRVLFLADGHVVHELLHPTTESVLDTVGTLGG